MAFAKLDNFAVDVVIWNYEWIGIDILRIKWIGWNEWLEELTPLSNNIALLFDDIVLSRLINQLVLIIQVRVVLCNQLVNLTS